MPKEIETKFKIESPVRVKMALKRIGAKFLSKGLERDLYYRGPVGSPFSGTVRLRRLGKDGVFTIKNPVKGRHSRLYKIRREFETTVKDHKTFDFILKELGFKVLFTKEKMREIYKWKNAKVSLDNLPFMGHYIEIEGPRKSIKELARLLELNISKGIRETYMELFSAYKRLHKKPGLELAFSKKTR